MTTRRHSQAGFSLIELMMVVSIIGIISAMGVTGIINITKIGRVNGTATTLARMLANARTRSILERCPYVAQISGQTWSPTAAVAGMRTMPRGVVIYKKADCTSTNGTFEVGDFYVSEFSMDDSTGRVLLATNPAAIVPGGFLNASSLAISWSTTGARSIYVDASGAGTYAADTVVPGGADLILTVVPRNVAIPVPVEATQRNVNIPAAGPAKAP
jgi:prepilin-type N-terminal cleavage/methylation domain-containing protein